MKEHCWISSFNPCILRCIEELNSEHSEDRIRTIYLHNFYNHIGLPPLNEVVKTGWGVNISYEHLTEEVVEACHTAGQIVAVWIDASVTQETIQMYKRLIDLKVDCFCTDFPLEVTQLRDQLMDGNFDMNKLQIPSMVFQSSDASTQISQGVNCSEHFSSALAETKTETEMGEFAWSTSKDAKDLC